MSAQTNADTFDIEYKLRRDLTESVRLTGQHYVLEKRQGWLLHPTIEASLQGESNPQIADVAAGNGIWTMEVAEHMPHASVTGLDISTEQYPPQWTLPKNVQFDTYDLLKDVPPHYQNRFDVVHVRLLILAGPRVDKSVFLSKFYQLLKPGGWLQWDELAYPVITKATPAQDGENKVQKSPSSVDAHVQTFLEFAKADELVSWVNQIDKVFTGSNFIDTEKYVLPKKPHLLKYESSLVAEVLVQISEAYRSRGESADGKMVERLDNAAQSFESNFADKDGEIYSYHFIIGIGRKP